MCIECAHRLCSSWTSRVPLSSSSPLLIPMSTVVWKLPCDVLVEEFHPHTSARQAQWSVKQSRLLLEDDADCKSATLHVPRSSGQSIAIKLLGADFTVHTNFLRSEGKCSLRFLREGGPGGRPLGLAVMLSNITPAMVQGAVHLLRAVQASKAGKPDASTSSSFTGMGDFHENDASDRLSPPPKAGSRGRKRKTDSDDDEEDKENAPPAHSNARIPLHAAAGAKSSSSAVAAKPSSSSSSSAFLSPQSLRFLCLPRGERARVLEAHAGFKLWRLARARADPSYVAREGAWDSALADPALTLEQREVILAVARGQNIFFTGSAGTGKSFLLGKLISALPGIGSSTFVTSTTGVTATALSGGTLWHWAGLGAFTGLESPEDLVGRVVRNRELLSRWRGTRTLLVDEVSMLSSAALQMVHLVAQRVRGSSLPFGGIQVVLSGDFFQLPPVTKAGAEMQFAFEASVWSGAFGGDRGRCVELGKVFRQSSSTFVELLDDLRRGNCSQQDEVVLQGLEHTDLLALEMSDGIKPTALVTLRSEVDAINTRELGLLRGEVQRYVARTTGSAIGQAQLADSCPARETLELKLGAQVILLRNLDVSAGLSNGSRGVVVRFAQGSRHPVVRFASGQEHTITPCVFASASASREQLPLDLAWALSIHKSQGMSLDRARVNLARCFEYGQAYVALSRLRSLEGLQLIGFDRSKIKAHPKVISFYDRLGEARHQADQEREQLRLQRLSPNARRKLEAHLTLPVSEEKPATTAASSSTAHAPPAPLAIEPLPRLVFPPKKRLRRPRAIDSSDDEGEESMKN